MVNRPGQEHVVRIEPGDDLAARLKLADELIDVAFPAGEGGFIAVKHGARIIAAAALRDAGDKVSNLPLGVCVLNEYRNRGIGSELLYQSLLALKEAGFEKARAITKSNVQVAKFVYTKFNSVAEPWDFEPVVVRS